MYIMITMTDPIFSCYLLELQENKFYAGSTLTNQVEFRFKKHKEGLGAKWCYRYKPIRIIKTWHNLTSEQAFSKEHSVCIGTMLQHEDLDSCRGGTFNFPFTGKYWWVPRILAHLIPKDSSL